LRKQNFIYVEVLRNEKQEIIEIKIFSSLSEDVTREEYNTVLEKLGKIAGLILF